MRRKVLILFPEGNLPYSPTTLNLAKILLDHFDVTIVTNIWNENSNIENLGFDVVRLNDGKYKKKTLFNRGINKIRKILFPKEEQQIFASQEDKEIFLKISKAIDAIHPDIIIAVDLFALYCCDKLNLSCNFLSLEIPAESVYYTSLQFDKINCVIIQSIDRYNYLFSKISKKPDYFILPNAPVFHHPERRTRKTNKIVYTGNIWAAFGPQFCMTFITKYSEYTLGLKGAITDNMVEEYFPYLLQSKNIVFDYEYLDEKGLQNFLLDYSIGFCFYNFAHPFIKRNSFNYETGPSGKLFAYLSIGLPVICSDLPGFRFVEDHKAGVLVKDFAPDTIKNAVDMILADYSIYSDNALALGKQNCFNKKSESILHFFLNS